MRRNIKLVSAVITVILFFILNGIMNAIEINTAGSSNTTLSGDTFWIILLVILLLFGIIFGMWAYQDAKSRGMAGAVWLIIIIFTSFIGFVAYLFSRKDKTYRIAL